MTKHFCDICGWEIGSYSTWSVKLHSSNDPKPPPKHRYAGQLCERCIQPVLEIIRKAHP